MQALAEAAPSGLRRTPSTCATKRTVLQRAPVPECRDWCFRAGGDDEWAPPCSGFVEPNVRAKRATTAGRQGPDWENVPRTPGRALAACRWRSA